MRKSKFTVEDQTGESMAEIEKAIDAGLGRVALRAMREIVKSMPKNPSIQAGEGRWIKAYGSMTSAPGSPPMQQTGNLAKNIISGKTERMKHAVGTKRGFAKAPYGYYLDQGTSKMAKRPWLGSTINKISKKLAREFEEGFKHALGGDD